MLFTSQNCPQTIWKYFRIGLEGNWDETSIFNVFCQTLCNLAMIVVRQVKVEEGRTGKDNSQGLQVRGKLG